MPSRKRGRPREVPAEEVLGLLQDRHWSDANGRTDATDARIARKLRCSTKTVSRRLRELRDGEKLTWVTSPLRHNKKRGYQARGRTNAFRPPKAKGRLYRKRVITLLVRAAGTPSLAADDLTGRPSPEPSSSGSASEGSAQERTTNAEPSSISTEQTPSVRPGVSSEVLLEYLAHAATASQALGGLICPPPDEVLAAAGIDAQAFRYAVENSSSPEKALEILEKPMGVSHIVALALENIGPEGEYPHETYCFDPKDWVQFKSALDGRPWRKPEYDTPGQEKEAPAVELRADIEILTAPPNHDANLRTGFGASDGREVTEDDDPFPEHFSGPNPVAERSLTKEQAEFFATVKEDQGQRRYQVQTFMDDVRARGPVEIAHAEACEDLRYKEHRYQQWEAHLQSHPEDAGFPDLELDEHARLYHGGPERGGGEDSLG